MLEVSLKKCKIVMTICGNLHNTFSQLTQVVLVQWVVGEHEPVVAEELEPVAVGSGELEPVAVGAGEQLGRDIGQRENSWDMVAEQWEHDQSYQHQHSSLNSSRAFAGT